RHGRRVHRDADDGLHRRVPGGAPPPPATAVRALRQGGRRVVTERELLPVPPQAVTVALVARSPRTMATTPRKAVPSDADSQPRQTAPVATQVPTGAPLNICRDRNPSIHDQASTHVGAQLHGRGTARANPMSSAVRTVRTNTTTR